MNENNGEFPKYFEKIANRVKEQGSEAYLRGMPRCLVNLLGVVMRKGRSMREYLRIWLWI